MTPKHQKRDHWSSKFNFILVAAGSAVGLGNIWKFPYIAGENGGGAFVLVYLGFIVIVGLPIFLAELFVGQNGQADPVGCFEKVSGKKDFWRYTGWLGVASAAIILSFYSVVGGWILDYVWLSVTGVLSVPEGADEAAVAAIGGQFEALLASPGRNLFWHFLFMALTVWVVHAGIRGGIEKWARILMPLLGGILVALLFWCFSLPGFSEALVFLFTPDFSKLSSEAVLVALGHSFFTLSLGLAAMVTYGSYLDKKEPILWISGAVAAADTLIALLAGVVIFSVVFTFNMEPEAGPGLLFATLPTLFAQVWGGAVVSVLFFLLVSFAALSSSISLLEVVVTTLIERRGWTRNLACVVAGAGIYLLGVLSAFSFNILSDVKITSKGWTFFDFFDGITANILLPLGGLLTSLFFGWVIRKKVLLRFSKEGQEESSYFELSVVRILLMLGATITPLLVVLILVQNLKNWIFA